MALETPQQQRFLLIGLALFSFLLLIGIGYLIYDSRDAEPALASPVILPRRDSIRTKLAAEAERSGDALPDFHQRSTKNVTKYEKAVSHYDSNRVELP